MFSLAEMYEKMMSRNPKQSQRANDEHNRDPFLNDDSSAEPFRNDSSRESWPSGRNVLNWYILDLLNNGQR